MTIFEVTFFIRLELVSQKPNCQHFRPSCRTPKHFRSSCRGGRIRRLSRMRGPAQPLRSDPPPYVTSNLWGQPPAGVFQNGSAEAPPRPQKVPGRPFGGCAVVAKSGGLENRAWWAPRPAGCLECCLEGTAWRELIRGARAAAWKYGDLHRRKDRGEKTRQSRVGRAGVGVPGLETLAGRG